MTPGTLLVETGQTWKLGVAAVCVIIGGILVLAAAFFPSIDRAWVPISLIGGFTFAFFGALLITIGIRCPKCGCAFVWREIRELDLSTWLDDPAGTNQCPDCGFAAGHQSSPPVRDE